MASLLNDFDNSNDLEIPPSVRIMEIPCFSGDESGKLTGLEIQPYLPLPEQNGDADIIHPQRDPQFPTPSAEDLKSPPTAEIEQDSSKGVLQVVPLSFGLPEVFSSDMLRIEMQLVPRIELHAPMKTVRHPSTVVAEGHHIIFKLPENWVNLILKWDEERLAKLVKEEQMSSNESRLSLFERLEGWSYNKRQRQSTQRFDKYYYHEKSDNRMFRSFVEVKKFIVSGTYPKRPQYIKDRQSKEGSLMKGSESLQQAPLKRKRTRESFNRGAKPKKQKCPPPAYGQAAMTLQMVAECLERERNNLVRNNLHNCGEQKEYKSSSSDDLEEETPPMTPKAGNESLRRFHNLELNVPRGNAENIGNEQRRVEGEKTTRPPHNFALSIEGPTIIPDLFIPDDNFARLEKFLLG